MSATASAVAAAPVKRVVRPSFTAPDCAGKAGYARYGTPPCMPSLFPQVTVSTVITTATSLALHSPAHAGSLATCDRNLRWRAKRRGRPLEGRPLSSARGRHRALLRRPIVKPQLTADLRHHVKPLPTGEGGRRHARSGDQHVVDLHCDADPVRSRDLRLHLVDRRPEAVSDPED